MNPLIKAFARNRAEEIGDDLWNDFIVPLFYDKLPLGAQRKPLMIVGGRGCGKTTLLRYLSHRTQFSPKRTDEPNLKSIGLYLRADTLFLRSFQGGELDQRKWSAAFEHYLALALGIELLESLKSINSTDERRKNYGRLSDIQFSQVLAFDETAPSGLDALLTRLVFLKNRFSIWLNNFDSVQKPIFFGYRAFLTALIQDLREQLPYLKDSDFFVFVDEYENLLPYQQEIVNTALKHSEPPLIFNIASKRNGIRTYKTVGEERLQEPDDYRSVDIEEEIGKHNFPLFAAELFFFRLAQMDIHNEALPINPVQLRDPTQVAVRREDAAYEKEVLKQVNRILPGRDGAGLARDILADGVLRKRLEEWIDAGIKRSSSKLSSKDFISDQAPAASIICGALLHQERKRSDEVHTELKLRISGSPGKFGEWEHKYLIGSVLYLYSTLQRPCPFYSGFDAYIRLAGTNTRHFLELCHWALLEQRVPKVLDELSIPIEKQAIAARRASALFVDDIKGSGDCGNRLHTLVATLGQIFQLSQQRPSQSETEKTHFSLPAEGLSDVESNLLSEAEKWSVLIKQEETKVKDTRFKQFEYLLNPIYAPYFGISYNKGRKLELSSDQAKVLLSGGNVPLTRLIQEFRRSWFKDSGDQISLLRDDP